MKAKNELNGTDKAVSDNQTVVVQVVAIPQASAKASVWLWKSCCGCLLSFACPW